MKFINSDNLDKITDTTLEQFSRYSTQILIELHEDIEHSENSIILDTFNVLSNDEIYYHLQYHQKIIINFLYIQQIDILNDFFISSYRVFLKKGAKSEFFLVLYNYFKNACSKYLFSSDMVNIERIYNYLELNHENFINYSQKQEVITIDEETLKLYEYASIGEFENGVLLCEPYCKDIDSFNHFFATKITSLMNYVGYEWEVGNITFALEHKISSFLDSILDYFITKLNTLKIENSKTILIANAPNEEHTLGVKLISNSLIKLGYTVLRLDNDAPLEQTMKVIEKVKPDYVAFSVTLVSNIYELTTIIEKLKIDLEHNQFKVIVGGRALENIENPAIATKADLYFENIEKLVEYFRR
jgi:methanogenic corrinoid protein MtbC1